MKIRLESADGLSLEYCDSRSAWEPQMYVRTAVRFGRPLDRPTHGLPFPGMPTRTYDLVNVTTTGNSYGAERMATYRERVESPPAAPPPVTPQALARAIFDRRHEAEALKIAERPERLAEVLRVMRDHTKTAELEACVAEATVLLERARRPPC